MEEADQRSLHQVFKNNMVFTRVNWHVQSDSSGMKKHQTTFNRPKHYYYGNDYFGTILYRLEFM